MKLVDNTNIKLAVEYIRTHEPPLEVIHALSREDFQPQKSWFIEIALRPPFALSASLHNALNYAGTESVNRGSGFRV